jgi:hypothetical protein
LDSEALERENRGRQYLAYFFHLVPKGILANPPLKPEERHHWRQIVKTSNGRNSTKAAVPHPAALDCALLIWQAN